MIHYNQAYKLVLDEYRDYGKELVPIKSAAGRILSENVKADRDFPPADRSTRDGIAISYEAIESGRMAFEIQGVMAAGKKAQPFPDKSACVEIMTGALIPMGADTVIPYEHLSIDQGIASIEKVPNKKQFIHFRGTDYEKNTLLLHKGRQLNPADIGILAAVGKKNISVLKLPRIAVISTGDELVDVDQKPQKHQIRRSNTYSLYSALESFGIEPLLLHISDDPDMIRQKLSVVIDDLDVVIISGGVSKGRYDFIPRILEELKVEVIFHRVQQRPGKPFLFGVHRAAKAIIFSFPGNPVSTFFNYHLYFVPWLRNILGLASDELSVLLKEDLEVEGELLQLQGAVLTLESTGFHASVLQGQQSGNMLGLSKIDGFIKLDPAKAPFKKNTSVPFIRTKQF